MVVAEGRVTVYSRLRWLSWPLIVLTALLIAATTVSGGWGEHPGRLLAAALGAYGAWNVRRPVCEVNDRGVRVKGRWAYLRSGLSLEWDQIERPVVIREDEVRDGPLHVAIRSDVGVVKLGSLPRYSTVLAELERRLGTPVPDGR